MEEGGFLYDSDYYGDELPFWVTVDGKAAARSALLASPTTTASSADRHRHLGPVVLASCKRRLRHATTAKAPAQPKMMSVGLHMPPDRPSGARRRAGAACSTISWASMKGVWVTRRVDIAKPLASRPIPMPGKGLNE